MVCIGKHIVILLYKGNDVFRDFIRYTLGVHGVVHLFLALQYQFGVWISVRHHDNHPLGFALSYEIIEDVVHTAYLVSISHTVDKIKHGKFLATLRIITSGRIDTHRTVNIKIFGVIKTVGHLTLRNTLDVLYRWLLSVHVTKITLEILVGEDEHIVGVVHLCTINDEAIGIDIGLLWSYSNTPDTIGIFLHRLVTTEHLTFQFHLLSLGSLETESDGTILVVFGRNNRFGEHAGHYARGELLILTGGRSIHLLVAHRTTLSHLVGIILEEQAQRTVEEITGIHPGMTVLVVRKHLDILNLMLIKIVHETFGVTIEEIVGTHT